MNPFIYKIIASGMNSHEQYLNVSIFVEYILSCVNIGFLLEGQKYYERDKTSQNMVILALNVF